MTGYRGWQPWSMSAAERDEEEREAARYAPLSDDERIDPPLDPDEEWAAMGEDREYGGTLYGGRDG